MQRPAGNTNTDFWAVVQSFENVNSTPFIGKTVTMSFYARRGANYSGASNVLYAQLISGTGTDQNVTGFTGYTQVISSPVTLTTTWQRFAFTGTVGSTATQLGINFNFQGAGTAGAADYFEVTGVQIDLGTYTASTAPTFRRSQGTIQGELAACQRYYFRAQSAGGFEMLSMVTAWTTTNAEGVVPTPVQMRIIPTVADAGNLSLQLYGGATVIPVTNLTVAGVAGKVNPSVAIVVASGLTVGSQYRILLNNTTAAYVAFSAEL
jgi:hypothetical protein